MSENYRVIALSCGIKISTLDVLVYGRFGCKPLYRYTWGWDGSRVSGSVSVSRCTTNLGLIFLHLTASKHFIRVIRVLTVTLTDNHQIIKFVNCHFDIPNITCPTKWRRVLGDHREFSDVTSPYLYKAIVNSTYGGLKTSIDRTKTASSSVCLMSAEHFHYSRWLTVHNSM